MKGESLTISINEATGEVEVVANGFVGHGCHAVQQAVSDALGTIVEEKKTPEYFKTTAVKKTQTQGR